MCYKKSGRKKLNKDGASLVTVIVVVAFITVLATTLLYISGMSAQIRSVNYSVQKNFYEGETVLEEIRAQLEKDMSDAFSAAYQELLTNYAAMDGEARAAAYQELFFNKLKDIWSARGAGTDNLDFSKACVETKYRDCIKGVGTVLYDTANYNYARLNQVNVIYTADGYNTHITTDFYIQLPEFNWDEDSIVAGGAKQIDFAEYISYMNWVKE